MFRWFIVIYSDDYLDTSGTCRFLQTSRSSISLTVKHHFPSTGWFEGKPIGSLGPWLNPEIELLFSFESMDGNHEEGYCGPFNGKNPCICCLCSKRTHAYIKWSSNVITKKKNMEVFEKNGGYLQFSSIFSEDFHYKHQAIGVPPWRAMALRLLEPSENGASLDSDSRHFFRYVDRHAQDMSWRKYVFLVIK